MGLGIDEQHGGMGGGLLGQVLASDILAQNGLISFASVLTSFSRASLLNYGTQAKIEKYAVPSISGEKAFCILATEPTAGTNTFNIVTRAIKRDGKWILNGQKTYITQAAKSDYGFLIAKTCIEAKGALSVFVLDMKSPGRADTEAARLLMYHSTKQFDEGRDAGMYANMAKLQSARAATDMADAAIQFHGGGGMDEDAGILPLWRAARTLKIAPVNNEMILNYIAQHGIGLPRSY